MQKFFWGGGKGEGNLLGKMEFFFTPRRYTGKKVKQELKKALL